jgi:6-methylpretetramide 4-monooxygenase / 4-hydroxy-6-methylpretetramide 12a-monooxygenase
VTVEVLVVGAGPVGLTAAYELARRGVAVRLVEARPDPVTSSRAIAVHPRTLETYDQMGLLDQMLAQGLPITAFTLYAGGRRLVRLDADYTEMPTRFPFTLSIDQVRTERVLREAVARLGVPVEWATRLDGFDQDTDGVRARLVHADGTVEQASAGWLVGCDGGHSTVRKHLGLPLIGESTETWLIADGQLDTELPRDSIYWVRAEGGTLMLAPLAGERRWRMLDTVDVDTAAGPDAVAQRFARKLSAGLGHAVRADPPAWVSVFTAQQRMVPRMHEGRVFVAGDAAHVHSPASGQGMNTGIQEAYNLAWKLAMVIRGEAGAALLDTFDAERVPVGRDLLGSTRNATALVALRNRLAGALLPLAFHIVRRVPALKVRGQRKALGRVSGLNVNYRTGPLSTAAVPDGTGGPYPGERVVQFSDDTPAVAALCQRLRGTGWTLLTAGGADAARVAADGYGDWLAVLDTAALPDADGRVAAAPHAGPGDWLLVRPDGYLAARGRDLTGETLARALAPAAIRYQRTEVAR